MALHRFIWPTTNIACSAAWLMIQQSSRGLNRTGRRRIEGRKGKAVLRTVRVERTNTQLARLQFNNKSTLFGCHGSGRIFSTITTHPRWSPLLPILFRTSSALFHLLYSCDLDLLGIGLTMRAMNKLDRPPKHTTNHEERLSRVFAWVELGCDRSRAIHGAVSLTETTLPICNRVMCCCCWMWTVGCGGSPNNNNKVQEQQFGPVYVSNFIAGRPP